MGVKVDKENWHEDVANGRNELWTYIAGSRSAN